MEHKEEKELSILNNLLLNPNLNIQNKEYLNVKIFEKLSSVYRYEPSSTEYLLNDAILNNKELVEKKLENINKELKRNSKQIILNFIETANTDNYSESLPELSLALKTKYNILDFNVEGSFTIDLTTPRGNKQNINKYIVKQLSEILIKGKIKQLEKEITNLKNEQ